MSRQSGYRFAGNMRRSIEPGPCPDSNGTGHGLDDNRVENDTRMTTRDIITEKLTKAFQPESLKVVDESHRHEGHAGWRPGGETHYRLYIVSSAFGGKSRVERHR